MASKHSNLLWWGPPKNFSDRQHERKISWLELFYDLVYVAAVSQLTSYLSGHPSWANVWYSFLLFSLVFWSWVNGSQYYDLHGSDSIRTRIMTLWQMLAVAAVAITIQDAFDGRQQGFAVAFAVIQILITYLWWSVGLYDPTHRVFNKFYTFNYLVAFALIIVSVYTSYHTSIILWVAALLFNVTPPLTGARTVARELKKRGEIFTASATIVERFGQFTIIVLAESILGTVNGIAEVKEKNPADWIAFILAILIAFLLWCLYFDMTSGQEAKKGYGYMQGIIFLHFPLLTSFCVSGACTKYILANMETALPATIQWMFCVSIAITLLMIVGIAGLMEQEEEDKVYILPVSRSLVVFSIILLVLPLFGHYLGNISFLSAVALILFIPVFGGITKWVRYKFFSK